MCKNVISTCYLLFFTVCMTQAQSLDFGFFMGLSGYMGDLQTSHLERKEFNLSGGFIGKYRINEFVDARVTFTKGELSGKDRGRNENRNLSFKSKIKELNLIAEFHPLSFIDGDRPVFSPYVFGGIAAFHHNPKAAYNNQWYDLQPLSTEGQSPYGLYQMAIPGGAGAIVYLTEAISIGFEAGLRKTFTDYLDDVSGTYSDVDALRETNPVAAALAYRIPEYLEVDPLDLPNPMGGVRGNPKRKDAYFFTGLTLMINIGGLMELAGGPGVYNPFE
jgi:Domain of unknown function (DUF6089)